MSWLNSSLYQLGFCAAMVQLYLISMDRVMTAISNLKVTNLPELEFQEGSVPTDGAMNFNDLPWKPLHSEATTHCTHALDAVSGLDEKPDLMQALLNIKIQEPLPDAFTFKAPLPPDVIQYTTHKDTENNGGQGPGEQDRARLAK